ncbi:MAG: pyridoxamine 5'-phosphate oxidase [Spirochaetales bacterium]|nr:pyridoxamine 5'-phosphate oxidase [Spirochaetales bacterium]
MPPDPLSLFAQWLKSAREHPEIKEPTAMALATCSAAGQPSVRMVLLKESSAAGFVFYTNLGSRKARELAENPRAGLCFFWQPLGRQVRVDGFVQPVSAQEADRYFASRDRLARLGAWASRQSQEEKHPFALERRVARYALKFGGGEVERPPFWSGYRLVPESIEFWQAGSFRLHERLLYISQDGVWQEPRRLYP